MECFFSSLASGKHPVRNCWPMANESRPLLCYAGSRGNQTDVISEPEAELPAWITVRTRRALWWGDSAISTRDTPGAITGSVFILVKTVNGVDKLSGQFNHLSMDAISY